MIDAILYLGQSNVSGLSTAGLPAGVPLSAVRYWIRGISGGTTDAAWHALQQWPDGSASFGPALAMGVALNAIWPNKIAILQINRGGSSMVQWQPGQFYHTAALGTIATAKALLLAEFPGETQVRWHFVWQQGETELQSGDLSAVNAWAAGFTTMKASFDTAVGQTMHSIIIGTNANISGASNVAALRAQQQSVANRYVNTDWATTVDGLHNDSTSNNTIGVTVAAAIVADEMGLLDSGFRSLLVSHWRGVTTYTRPASLEYRAYSGGVVLSGNGYAHATVTNDATQYPAAASGIKTNANPIDFGMTGGATATWPPVDEIREYDASGNLRHTHRLAVPQTITSGFKLRIPAGALRILAPSGYGLVVAERNALLDHGWGGPNLTPRANTFGSYWLGDPQGAGSQLGVRAPIANSGSGWGPASGGTDAINVDVALTQQGTATHWAEHSLTSGGALVASTPLPAPPASGTIPSGLLQTAFT